jgi:DNA-binding MarR family transcriptional regulator
LTKRQPSARQRAQWGGTEAARLWRRVGDDKEGRQTEPGLFRPPVAGVMLRELFDEPAMTPSVVAERMGMTRGAISKLADRLVAKALVVRTASEDDRRFQTLALTSSGRKLTPTLVVLADDNDEEFFGCLKPTQRAAIEAAMRKIVLRHGMRAAPLK